MNTVCVLGLGEVGAILAKDILLSTNLNVVVWDIGFAESNSLPNRHLAGLPDARVHKAIDAVAATEDADLIISVVTAHQTVAAAASVVGGLRKGTWYLDLNSVSPETKRRAAEIIAGQGGRFVEAAIMSPIAPKRIATPILLAGSCAGDFLPLAHELGFSGMSHLSAERGQAAAVKMCRSVLIKGIEALVTESLVTAHHFGVEGEVFSSLNDLFPDPDWTAQARYMISRSLEHGERRAEEMSEAVKTVRGANIEPWMSEACVERQRWAGRLAISADDLQLPALLGAIAASLKNKDRAPVS